MTFNRSSQKKFNSMDYSRSLSSARFKATIGWIHWTGYVLVFASLCGTYLELIYLFAAVTRRQCTHDVSHEESSLVIKRLDMYASYTVNLGLGYITRDSHYQWISISLSRMLAFIDLLYLWIYPVPSWIMTESSQFIGASSWPFMSKSR